MPKCISTSIDHIVSIAIVSGFGKTSASDFFSSTTVMNRLNRDSFLHAKRTVKSIRRCQSTSALLHRRLK